MPKEKGQSNKLQLPLVVQKTSSKVTPKSSSLIKSSKHKRSTDQLSNASSRSQSPTVHHPGSSNSPPMKKSYRLSNSDSESAHQMQDSDQETSSNHTSNRSSTKSLQAYLLTNFDARYQTPKLLLNRFLQYIPRTKISQIIPTKNGTIIKSPDSTLATTIRNKYNFEIFGSNAQRTSMNNKPIHQQPPPRRSPILSVVIRGVAPDISDSEAEQELRLEGHTLTKCIRIKTQQGTSSYMVRILTNHQSPINRQPSCIWSFHLQKEIQSWAIKYYTTITVNMWTLSII